MMTTVHLVHARAFVARAGKKTNRRISQLVHLRDLIQRVGAQVLP